MLLRLVQIVQSGGLTYSCQFPSVVHTLNTYPVPCVNLHPFKNIQFFLRGVNNCKTSLDSIFFTLALLEIQYIFICYLLITHSFEVYLFYTEIVYYRKKLGKSVKTLSRPQVAQSMHKLHECVMDHCGCNLIYINALFGLRSQKKNLTESDTLFLEI